MFFKRKRKKAVEEEKSVPLEPLDTTQLKKQKLPIITLDNSWHQLISEIKTPQINALEKEVNALLKEQGKLNTDYIEYSKLKKEMLDTILELTHEAFELGSDQAVKKIEDQQKMVLKINEKLEKIEPRLDVIPGEIEKTNAILVDQTAQLCYGYINDFRENSRVLDEEIQVIRSTLMKKTEEKKGYDKKSEQMYRFLHKIVGADVIEKLDTVYWETSK